MLAKPHLIVNFKEGKIPENRPYLSCLFLDSPLDIAERLLDVCHECFSVLSRVGCFDIRRSFHFPLELESLSFTGKSAEYVCGNNTMK